MRHLITGPDGTRHVLTEDEVMELALKQLFHPAPEQPAPEQAAEAELPPMVEIGDEMAAAPEPPPEAPYDPTTTNEPPPHTYSPEPEPAAPAPNPLEQIVPLIMEAIEKLSASIDNMGAEMSAGLAAQGKSIKAAAAQQAQSIAGLADAMGAEQEVVRDDEGRVKGSRRKAKELN